MSRRTNRSEATGPRTRGRHTKRTGSILVDLAPNLVAPRTRFSHLIPGGSGREGRGPHPGWPRTPPARATLRGCRVAARGAPDRKGMPYGSAHAPHSCDRDRPPPAPRTAPASGTAGPRSTSTRTCAVPGPIRSIALAAASDRSMMRPSTNRTRSMKLDLHALLVAQIDHPDPRIERESAVRRHQLLHIVDFPIGGRPAMVGVSIPTGGSRLHIPGLGRVFRCAGGGWWGHVPGVLLVGAASAGEGGQSQQKHPSGVVARHSFRLWHDATWGFAHLWPFRRAPLPW